MRAIILSLLLLLAAATTAAQSIDAPQLENARVEKKALAGPLAAEVKAWTAKAEGPQWLGYAVPQIGRDRTMCCGDSARPRGSPGRTPDTPSELPDPRSAGWKPAG